MLNGPKIKANSHACFFIIKTAWLTDCFDQCVNIHEVLSTLSNSLSPGHSTAIVLCSSCTKIAGGGDNPGP